MGGQPGSGAEGETEHGCSAGPATLIINMRPLESESGPETENLLTVP